MQDLLAKYHVGVQPGQIASSIDFGRARELTLAGVFAFVDDKLIEKREQGDAVYSAQLLIKAIRSEADLPRWISKSYRCSSYFERTSACQRASTRSQAPFSPEELSGHLSACSGDLRVRPEYGELASELDLLVS